MSADTGWLASLKPGDRVIANAKRIKGPAFVVRVHAGTVVVVRENGSSHRMLVDASEIGPADARPRPQTAGFVVGQQVEMSDEGRAALRPKSEARARGVVTGFDQHSYCAGPCVRVWRDDSDDVSVYHPSFWRAVVAAIGEG